MEIDEKRKIDGNRWKEKQRDGKELERDSEELESEGKKGGEMKGHGKR